MALETAPRKILVPLQREVETFSLAGSKVHAEILRIIEEGQRGHVPAPEGKVFSLEVLRSAVVPCLAARIDVYREETFRVLLEGARSPAGDPLDLASVFAPPRSVPAPPRAPPKPDLASVAPPQARREAIPVPAGAEILLRVKLGERVRASDPTAVRLAEALLRRLGPQNESHPLSMRLAGLNAQPHTPFLTEILEKMLFAEPSTDAQRESLVVLRFFVLSLVPDSGKAEPWLREVLLRAPDHGGFDLDGEQPLKTVSGGKPVNFRRALELMSGSAGIQREQGIRILAELTSSRGSAAAASRVPEELAALETLEKLVESALHPLKSKGDVHARALHHLLQGSGKTDAATLQRDLHECRTKAEERAKAKGSE